MRCLPILIISFTLLSCIQLQRVSAAHEEGFFDKFTSWLPFTNRLGHDWSDTQDKMEQIYRKNHEIAKERVDELREEAVEKAHLQERVAEIYQEAAMKSEKEIESMKHGLMDKLTSWRHHGPEPSEVEKRGFLERWGLKKPAPQPSELLPKHLWEDTSRKISEGYRTAVDTAKTKLGEAGSKLSEAGDKVGDKVGPTWQEAKKRAAHAYSEAFHKGHGEARSRIGQFRDVMERGLSGVARTAKNFACEAWNLFTHGLTGLTAMVLGGFLAIWGMQWMSRRRFRNQLTAHVAGPVMAIGEYMVFGDEEKQRKFFDFWTAGAGGSYFQRQPGCRRYLMHRAVGKSDNEWVCHSEWASIDDLRRAKQSNEFCEIKKRAPATMHKMLVVQLVSPGGIVKEGAMSGTEASGLRQRVPASSPTS